MIATVWNQTADVVAELVLRSHHEPADPQVPDGEQVLVVDQVRTLDRVGHLPGDSDWLRPILLNTVAKRLAPLAAGAKCYQDGWVLLERFDAPPGGVPAGQKLGPAREVPLVDLELGTATWYTLVDLDAGDLAAALAARKAAMIATVKARAAEKIADGFIYDLPGNDPADPHSYQIDDTAQGNMLAIYVEHLDGAVSPHGGYWRDRANVNVAMTAVQNKAFLEAAKAYKMAIIRRAQALVDAIVAAANHAALDLIDVAAGTVTVEGVPTGGWPG